MIPNVVFKLSSLAGGIPTIIEVAIVDLLAAWRKSSWWPPNGGKGSAAPRKRSTAIPGSSGDKPDNLRCKFAEHVG